MVLPELSLGLVVRYEYLWHRQAETGRQTAEKERPACIVFTFDDPELGQSVILLPISHSPPIGEQIGIEIPVKVQKHLGLDGNKSWVFVSECNIDSWPSPDLRSLPNNQSKFTYGHIPPRLFRIIRDAFVKEFRAKQVRQVRR
jgi:hypothetical protein